MNVLPIRLAPGQDLRQALEDSVRDRGWDAAFVLSGIGSLGAARLRLAGQPDPVDVAGPCEILTLAGSIARDGSHLHATELDLTVAS